MLLYIESFMMIFFTTLGQLLLKKGAMTDAGSNIINYYVITGYVSFVLVLLISYSLMHEMEMKFFSVIMSINYIAVMFMSILFFKESICKRKILGTLLVTFGVILFLYGR